MTRASAGGKPPVKSKRSLASSPSQRRLKNGQPPYKIARTATMLVSAIKPSAIRSYAGDSTAVRLRSSRTSIQASRVATSPA